MTDYYDNTIYTTVNTDTPIYFSAQTAHDRCPSWYTWTEVFGDRHYIIKGSLRTRNSEENPVVTL